MLKRLFCMFLCFVFLAPSFTWALTPPEREYLRAELTVFRKNLQELEAKRQGLVKALETLKEESVELSALAMQLQSQLAELLTESGKLRELVKGLEARELSLAGGLTDLKSGLAKTERERDLYFWGCVALGTFGGGALLWIFFVK